jgi:hypothetical protein
MQTSYIHLGPPCQISKSPTLLTGDMDGWDVNSSEDESDDVHNELTEKIAPKTLAWLYIKLLS